VAELNIARQPDHIVYALIQRRLNCCT